MSVCTCARDWGRREPTCSDYELCGLSDLRAENAKLRWALAPFAAFAEKAEQFVDARAKDRGSPIIPTNEFRLSDFQRARDALKQEA